MSVSAVAADPPAQPVAPLPQAEMLLRVEDIHTYYGKSHILDGVSLEIGRGEVVGLLGRNGVGKSTTLKAIAGLIHPSQGDVTFEGRSVARLPSHALARLGIAYVPEERRIFPFLTVLENLRTGLDRHGVGKPRKAALLDKAYAYFPRLAERRNQVGGTLSGGEQQMLAIARAMMLEPKIILLDEPTEGLMPRMVSQISEIIGVLGGEGVAVLLVEQNVPLTLQACRRIYFIEKGVVRHHALASELHVDHPAIHQYLGV
jgi:branched-chain amino acid transport system ATP-binding protein